MCKIMFQYKNLIFVNFFFKKITTNDHLLSVTSYLTKLN